jgi:hypothetical protein
MHGSDHPDEWLNRNLSYLSRVAMRDGNRQVVGKGYKTGWDELLGNAVLQCNYRGQAVIRKTIGAVANGR